MNTRVRHDEAALMDLRHTSWCGHDGLGWAIAFGVAAILCFALGGARGSGTGAVPEGKNAQTAGVR